MVTENCTIRSLIDFQSIVELYLCKLHFYEYKQSNKSYLFAIQITLSFDFGGNYVFFNSFHNLEN